MRSPVWHAGKRERLSLADGADFGATAIAAAAANGLLSGTRNTQKLNLGTTEVEIIDSVLSVSR